MTKRIFRSICLVALAVFMASLVLIMGVLYGYFSDLQKSQLKSQTELVAQGVEAQGEAFFSGLEDAGFRVTWIAPNGDVLYDNQADAAQMENHADRQEVIAAAESGYGESSRYSATLMEKLLYEAKRLPDGSVVRLSGTQDTVVSLILGMYQPILFIILVAAILSLLLAYRLSKRIVQPLNKLNLDDPLSGEGYAELAPLLRRIDSQQRQIRLQSSELKHRREEFDAVTASMNEGLVLLGSDGEILFINQSAARLLEADISCVGQNILSLSRSLPLRELLSRAQRGERAESVAPLGGGEYQLDASPVITDGAVTGVALLIFDVTEREKSEQMRREFTANVSHELKTPLHSISGCAELLNNGMVMPEDVKGFSAQIYSEAQRMIRLVDDIIRLSRLDEGGDEQKREETDLLPLAQDAVKSLSTEAAAAGVTLMLSGESAVIKGIPQLLGAIIFNLCDNSIKYNRPGGSVRIQVLDEGSAAVLSVADTGIGIPVEQQSRVFERFYRVDKSHSKEVGGTGLGLSIVKHAAQLHNARIELKSVPGEGTTVTLRFPKNAQ